MEKNINLIVEDNENDLRVDVFINKREKLISRTRIKNLILKKKLQLNDQIINSPAKKVFTGDKLSLKYPRASKSFTKALRLQTRYNI